MATPEIRKALGIVEAARQRLLLAANRTTGQDKRTTTAGALFYIREHVNAVDELLAEAEKVLQTAALAQL
ncbi:MAG TPA: hypothetical protein VKT20_01170 [Candidatus Dormibacteraeota bacterium]|nr:hypothetical protein [Candidatus Dormibacteraeota bacterium]